MDNPSQLAIKKTLEGNWAEAAKINLQILKSDPKNIDALNRLARAQTELGRTKDAETAYHKVLRLDKLNSIAQKNLARLKTLKPSKLKPNIISSPQQMFIEEPGKTKCLSLVKLASPDVLSRIDPGDSVTLTPRQHSISITLSDGTTIGRLPDDIAARLMPMIKSGNVYSSTIRSVANNSVKILIREEKRSKKFSNIPSFSAGDHSSYVTYLPPELIREDESSPTEETDEAEEAESS